MFKGRRVNMKDKVNFGSTKVLKADKPELVSNIFTSVSNKYDLMNDAMSFGLHRLWKNRMCDMVKIKNTDNVLDIATGTGDIALKLLNKNIKIDICCLDENEDMIDICKNRMIDEGYINNISYIKSSMEDASFNENSFSVATLAFGFRNFTDHKKALKNIYNLLSPGGRLVIMEFTTPKNKLIKDIYEKYTHKIIPKIGKALADDSESYKYLAESISSYYTPDEVLQLFKNAGFINCRFQYLPGNIVTIHIGYKS